jgi:hypothetical protein
MRVYNRAHPGKILANYVAGRAARKWPVTWEPLVRLGRAC